MFLGSIACITLWSGAYGIGLLVFEPSLRVLFEIPIWIGINFVGVFFLGFALQYTGRGYRLDSWWMGAIVLYQTLHTVLVVTNRVHHIAWSDYTITPTFGAATVTYTHQPWLFVNSIGVIALVATAVFLLLDTVISYGPLYRRQAVAVALSVVPPGIAYLLWLFELGPVPALNLTPLVFPLHLALDLYALFSREMFEFAPAARRMGERAAIDDLGSAVAIVDTDHRVITLNEEAERVLGTDRRNALGEPLVRLLESDTDPLGAGTTISLTHGGQRRDYAVTTSPITDPTGSEVGQTVLFQDITEERRREQRLEVLNRVLRHNIRNDLNVVQAYLEVGIDRVEDDELRDLLGTAERSARNVIELGEKSRTMEAALADTEELVPVEVRSVLDPIAAELREAHPDAVLNVAVPDDTTVIGTGALLEVVFRNLIENAIEHDDEPPTTVSVRRVTGADAGSEYFEIVDDGPGIPEHETAALAAGGEDDLRHGSGLGLWLVEWAVTALGGDVRFDADDGAGTTVTVRLPGAVADPS